MSKKYIDIEVFDGDDDIRYVRHEDMLNLLEQIRIKQEEKDKEIRRLYIALRNREQEIERLNNIINELEKWLEEEQDRLARETSNIYEDSLGKTRLVNENIYEEVKKIKDKLQELKGVDK